MCKKLMIFLFLGLKVQVMSFDDQCGLLAFTVYDVCLFIGA